MSMKAVVVREYGDSSKLSYEDVPIPEPGPGEVRKNNQYNQSSSCIVFKVTPFKLFFFCRFPPSKKKEKKTHDFGFHISKTPRDPSYEPRK